MVKYSPNSTRSVATIILRKRTFTQSRTANPTPMPRSAGTRNRPRSGAFSENRTMNNPWTPLKIDMMITSETASLTGIAASHQPRANRPVPNPARPLTRPPANAPMDTIIMANKLITGGPGAGYVGKNVRHQFRFGQSICAITVCLLMFGQMLDKIDAAFRHIPNPLDAQVQGSCIHLLPPAISRIISAMASC